MMKNVIVVGAAGGMGSSIASKLISENYNVFGIDISNNTDIDKLNYYQCDITKEDQLIQVYNQISSEIDGLFAIVFAAGIYKMDSLLEISDDEMKRILDINVLSVQRINRIFFNLLKENSRIVIITSELATLDPLPFNGIYTMSKSLLEKYAFSLRMEVNNFGIKVVTIRPGAVKTKMIGQSTSSMDEFVQKTKIQKRASTKFKKIVDSVESKTIEPVKIANLVNKILAKRKPKYSYSKNRNFGLKILNALPDRLQVKIISKIIK